ncbi:MAG: hypothetical protein ACW98K_05285, partial [Candidatus Kariarchaeaceae archaeon]|jgi:hypothetical protein
VLTWSVQSSRSQDTDYFIYQNGVQVDSGFWSGRDITTDINYTLPTLGDGIYNYTFHAVESPPQDDETYTDTIFITVDTNAPVFNNPIGSYDYEIGSINNSLIWNITEFSPKNYTIFKDNNPNVTEPNWINVGNVSIDIDGLNVGSYNFTIQAFDLFNRSSSNYVNVTVHPDSALFWVALPQDFSFNETTTGNVISWNASDPFPDKYTIYHNNVSIETGSWSTSENISLNVDELLKGIHNFTIVVSDTPGNKINNTVFVTVTDFAEPFWHNPYTEYNYEFFSTSNILEWNFTDNHPDEYYIFHNATSLGQNITSALWSSSNNITLVIDGLPIGTYYFKISVYDEDRNHANFTTMVTVYAGPPPVWTLIPEDTPIIFATTTNSVTWVATDNYPDIYILYRNGSIIIPGNAWTSGFPIFVSIDDLAVGIYNFTLTVLDKSGNSQTSTIFVTVLSIFTDQPSVSPVISVFEGYVDRISGTWQTNESTNIGLASIEIVLLQKNVLVHSQLLQTSNAGDYQFNLDYSDLDSGNYTWQVTFTKTGYQTQRIFVDVEILPHSITMEYLLPLGAIQQGEEFELGISIRYNDTATGLSLYDIVDTKSGGIPGVNVTVEFTIKDNDGIERVIIKSGLTDSSGIAEIILSETETGSISELLGFTIQDLDFPIDAFDFSDNDLLSLNAEIKDLHFSQPIIFSTGTTGGTDIFELDQYILYIYLIIIIFLMLIILRSLRKRGKRNRERLLIRFEQEKQDAVAELIDLTSIRAIIMHSLTNQSPFYDERFGRVEPDSVMITGLISAISSFLDEFDDEESKGFQTMEKIGLSLTSHKSTISSITVVSNGTISQNFLEKVKHVHKNVDTQYESQIQQLAILPENFDQNIIAELLELGGLNLHLLRGMNLDVNKLVWTIKKRKKELHKYEVPLLKTFINLPEKIIQDLRLDSLMDHLEKEIGLQTAEAARTIILAVEKKVLTPRMFLISDDYHAL